MMATACTSGWINGRSYPTVPDNYNCRQLTNSIFVGTVLSRFLSIQTQPCREVGGHCSYQYVSQA
eukprot:m.73544 g.73544  ORF g.73544 m.73544 type:complete len:65 (+) comp35844_c0_seq3:1845-2039(+)